MIRKVLANTIYLECLTFAITILLAASDVEGKNGGKEQPREIKKVVGRAYNSHSLCYNNQNQEVKCSKKKGIVVGSVIGTLFVLLGVLYLYCIWSEKRKKRRGSPIVEENEPLSNASGTISDCEKGVIKASNMKNENDDDCMISSLPHLDKSEEASVSDASSVASDLPGHGYDRPPGLAQADKPLATSDPGRKPLTNVRV